MVGRRRPADADTPCAAPLKGEVFKDCDKNRKQPTPRPEYCCDATCFAIYLFLLDNRAQAMRLFGNTRLHSLRRRHREKVKDAVELRPHGRRQRQARGAQAAVGLIENAARGVEF